MKIKESINEFLFHCKFEKNLSPKSIKAYKIDLTQFMNFPVERELTPVSDISRDLIRSYLRHLSNSYKPRSVKRKMIILKSFFGYLEFDDKILVSPFRKMRITIKQGISLPRVIKFSNIEALFRHLYLLKKNSRKAQEYKYKTLVRDIAILELLFATGMRVFEVSGLLRENVDLENKLVRINGKGNKERVIPICGEHVEHAFEEYFSMASVRSSDSPWAFVNRLGNRLSEQSIRFMIKNYTSDAEIDEHITPHMFRHSVATYLLKNGVDICYIQYLLGHSSIATTQIYAHIDQEAHRKEIELKHPRKEILFSGYPNKG